MEARTFNLAAAALGVVLFAALGVAAYRSNAPESPSIQPEAVPATMKLQVFFSNPKLAPKGATDCSLVYPVERTLPRDANVSRVALLELFKGPSADEAAQGFTSPFSDATRDMLVSVRVDRATAYVDFKDFRKMLPNASSACGGLQFRSQVEATLQQFPVIGKVIYAIGKIPQTFYEFMQLGCDWKTTTCDGANFP